MSRRKAARTRPRRLTPDAAAALCDVYTWQLPSWWSEAKHELGFYTRMLGQLERDATASLLHEEREEEGDVSELERDREVNVQQPRRRRRAQRAGSSSPSSAPPKASQRQQGQRGGGRHSKRLAASAVSVEKESRIDAEMEPSRAVVKDLTRLIQAAVGDAPSSSLPPPTVPSSSTASTSMSKRKRAKPKKGQLHQQQPPPRSLSLNAEAMEDDDDEQSQVHRLQAEAKRREEEELEELYAVQSMLDSFYDNVSEGDEEQNEDDGAQATPKRRRKDYRELRYRGQTWTDAECVQVGWFTVRDEALPPPTDAVVEEEKGHSEVELVVVEKQEPTPSSVNHFVRYMSFFREGLVRRFVTTRTPSSLRRARQQARKMSAKRKQKQLQALKATRVFIHIDGSDSSPDSTDSAFSSPSSEEKEEEPAELTFTTNETLVRQPIALTSPLPLHPLSVIHTHRPDNAIDDDTLHALTYLYLKGFLSLRCTRNEPGRCYDVKVALTPQTVSADSRASAEERRLLTLVMQWACDCDGLEDAEHRPHLDEVFEPRELYAAALPPKRQPSTAPVRRGLLQRLDETVDSQQRAAISEDKGHVLDGDVDDALMAEDGDDDSGAVQQLTQLEQPWQLTQSFLSSLGLLPQLRPYQLQAASWMVQREANPDLDPAHHLPELSVYWKACRLYEPCPNTGVEVLWLDVMRGVVAKRVVEGEELNEMRGGLLCDEMGLGKTVMCLALFLAHRRPLVPSSLLHSHYTIFPESSRLEEQKAREAAEAVPVEARATAPGQRADAVRSLIRINHSPHGNGAVTLPQQQLAGSIHAPHNDEVESKREVQRSLSAALDGNGNGDEDSDDGEAEYGRPPEHSSPQSAPSAAAARPAEVVDCFCGEESPDALDQFVCCDRCNTWQHWRCVSYFPSSSPSTDIYICPACSAAAPPLPIKATLVCCPDVILGQWKEEIERHCAKHKLRVLVYSGVKRAGDTSTAGNSIEKMRRQEETRRRREEREEEERNAKEEKEAHQVEAMDDTAPDSTFSNPTSLRQRSTSSQSSPKSGGGSEAPVSYRIVRPEQLASYDVILTTYTVLRSDLYHAPTAAAFGAARPLRSRKRYRVMPSPLTSVQYWRVVLDESQMMGEGTANCARMCLLLPAINRWGVSGTVISKGLDDLYGLLLFLQAQPYSERRYWDQFLSLPYQLHEPLARKKLHAITRRLMWRNTKESVQDELALPQLLSHLHSVSFTPVEAYYYTRREEECQQVSAVVQSKKRTASSALSHSQQQSMLHSLLRLRQACDHHQLGASTGFVSLQKHTLSMREMTSELKEEARLKGEEAQRLMFFAMNALGSLRMIRQEWREAMQLYRQVLGLQVSIEDPNEDRWRREVEEERGRAGKRVIQMDISQEIHALYNLAEAARKAYLTIAAAAPAPPASMSPTSASFASSPSSPLSSSSSSSSTTVPATKDSSVCPPALQSLIVSRVSFLQARVSLLQSKSLDRSNSIFFATQLKWKATHDESEAQHDSLTSSPVFSTWYSDAIDLVQSLSSNDPQDLLLRRVQAELADARTGYSRKPHSDAISISDQFSTLYGLRLIIANHVEGLNQARQRIINKLTGMVAEQPPSAEAIHLSVNCQRCKQLRGPVCAHCKCEVLVRQWEKSLYRFVKEMRQGWVRGANNIDQRLILAGSTREQQRAVTDGYSAAAQEEEAEEETLSKLDHEVEIALKAIHSFLTQHRRELARTAAEEGRLAQLIERGKLQLECLALQKKECQATRSLVIAHQHQLFAFDEINSSCTRIQIKQKTPEKKRPDGADSKAEAAEDERGRRERDAEAEKRNVLLGLIHEYEVPGLMLQYERDRLAASASLRESLSKMQFLMKQMADVEGEAEGREAGERDACPICLERDLRKEEEVVVLPGCGHRYCTWCILSLLEHVQHSASQWITCGVCRRKQKKTEMRYVSNTNKHRNDLEGRADIVGGVGGKVITHRMHSEAPAAASSSSSSSSPSSSSSSSSSPLPDAVSVKGSWSTKVNEVVSLVLSILSTSPQSKLLLFSEWKDMLLLLSKAFTLNQVNALLLLSRPTFSSTLHRFHHDPSYSVLLLPMKGSNEGLNLTAASHVIFVEPSLSRAREEQGVGRVWRIGQRSRCHVHRLVVERSVEERIHRRNERGGGPAGHLSHRAKRQKDEEVKEEEFDALLRPDDGSAPPSSAEKGEGQLIDVTEEDERQAEVRKQMEDELWWQGGVRFTAGGGSVLSRLEVLARLQRAAFFERSRREQGQRGKGEKERVEEKEEKEEKEDSTPKPSHGLRIVHHGRSVYADIARQIDVLEPAQ